MSERLTLDDVQRMADWAANPNPLIAGPARDRIVALAPERTRFEDEEAWLWAHDLARTWRSRGER